MFIIWLIILIIALYFWLNYMDYRHTEQTVPENSARIILRCPDKTTKNILGNKHEHMAIVEGQDRTVYFPDSANTSEHYYLTGVEFTPSFTSYTTTKGHGGRALVGGLVAGVPGAIIGASGKHKSKITTMENSSDCYLQLFKKEDLLKPVILKVTAKSDKVEFLQARMKLTDPEINHIFAVEQA